ncbi:MAG: hypothetical protein JJE18_04430 [Eubacteriaceae bacterium]|nr:hypothetical protein [Eubacteriaceae bacterium]
MIEKDDLTTTESSDASSTWSEKEIKAELRRMFLGGDDWSKEACMGYFLKACQTSNLDKETIQELALNLYRLFDEFSINAAKNLYYSECHSILSGRINHK